MSLSDRFVRRQSDRLVLNNEIFRIVGANIYYFAFSTEPDQIRLLDLVSDFGFNVLRIWAFNDFINLPPNPVVPIDTHLCFQFLNPGAGMPDSERAASASSISTVQSNLRVSAVFGSS